MARFDNKVVLVSGGARGQGAAEARLLVTQGAKVVIGDVLDNQGQALAAELGPAASFVRHDVTSEADWARAVEAAEKLDSRSEGRTAFLNLARLYSHLLHEEFMRRANNVGGFTRSDLVHAYDTAATYRVR